MAMDTLTLLLSEREAEVVEEALSLYLTARPSPADTRYDYRYRAAQSVLGSLQGSRGLPGPAHEDDGATRREDDQARRPKREQLED